jgi:hypothetical protein
VPNHLLGKRSSVLKDQRKNTFDVSIDLKASVFRVEGKKAGNKISGLSHLEAAQNHAVVN